MRNHNFWLIQFVSTNLGHNVLHTKSVTSSATNNSLALLPCQTPRKNRHPRGEILVISDWFLKWLLIGCWFFSLFCSNQIVSIILVVLFFHPGVETLVISGSRFCLLLIGSWWTDYVMTQSNILYHPRCFTLLKQIFLVVGGWWWVGGGGGGGGSDVKMGCTIYWKDFPR